MGTKKAALLRGIIGSAHKEFMRIIPCVRCVCVCLTLGENATVWVK